MAATMPEVPEARAIVRGIRISPRKVRIVVDLIRGKAVGDAIGILHNTPKRASKVVEKVLKSAMANAEANHDMLARDCYVHAIWVDGGPTLKRVHFRSRGQVFQILKRTSHITVVLRERHR